MAIKRLNGVLTRNRVKRELRLGEFYEKPSERRKRLAVERHRRRFQDLVSTAWESVGACADALCVGSTKSTARTGDSKSIVIASWSATHYGR